MGLSTPLAFDFWEIKLSPNPTNAESNGMLNPLFKKIGEDPAPVTAQHGAHRHINKIDRIILRNMN